VATGQVPLRERGQCRKPIRPTLDLRLSRLDEFEIEPRIIVAYCSPKRNQNLSRNYTMSNSVTLVRANLASQNTSMPDFVTADVFCDSSPTLRSQSSSVPKPAALMAPLPAVWR